MAELPAGRRALAKNEYLFITSRKKRCRPHLWVETEKDHSGKVVACFVCGKLKQGSSLPLGWPVLVP